MTIPARDDTSDLLRALVVGDALEKFQRLPLKDQDRFLGWIAKARDEEAHWRRIDILVSAMRMAPDVETGRRSPEPSGFWTNPMGRA